MNKVKWWLRIVGGFYLLGGGSTFIGLMVVSDAGTFWGPNPINSFLIGVLFYIVLGILMFLSSWNPADALSLVKIVALLELFAWIPCDVILLVNGSGMFPMIIYICFHIIIGLSGLALVKKRHPVENDSIRKGCITFH